MRKKRILVVDDDPNILDIVKSYLEKDNFAVRTAKDGNGALIEVQRFNPNLVILDLNLPGLSGEEVCQRIRKRSNVPILMLTAKTEEVDRIVGLEIGADDYVTKPFSPRELVARVRAIFRRVNLQFEEESPSELVFRDLKIDLVRHQVVKGDQIVELTPSELRLLTFMARRPGRVYRRSQLLEEVVGSSFEAYDRVIDAHVKNLRKKIEDDPENPYYVLTVWGLGYKFNENALSENSQL